MITDDSNFTETDDDSLEDIKMNNFSMVISVFFISIVIVVLFAKIMFG